MPGAFKKSALSVAWNPDDKESDHLQASHAAGRCKGTEEAMIWAINWLMTTTTMMKVIIIISYIQSRHYTRFSIVVWSVSQVCHVSFLHEALHGMAYYIMKA